VIYGNWQDPETKIWYSDINRRIWVDCDYTIFNMRYLKGLKKRLKRLLRQYDIYISTSIVNVLKD
jgi:hypothetical protein